MAIISLSDESLDNKGKAERSRLHFYNMHFTIKKRKQKEKQEESQFIKFSNNTIARQESKKESSKEKETTRNRKEKC